jgi:hypothetical protein
MPATSPHAAAQRAALCLPSLVGAVIARSIAIRIRLRAYSFGDERMNGAGAIGVIGLLVLYFPSILALSASPFLRETVEPAPA